MRTSCPGCPDKVPIVRAEVGQVIARRVIRTGLGERAWLADVADAAASWVLAGIPGVETCTGAQGRVYVAEEARVVAAELWRVEASPCPFAKGDLCLIGGRPEERTVAQMPGPRRFLWLPSLLLLHLAPDFVRGLVAGHRVADAKIAILTRPGNFPITPHAGAGNAPLVAPARGDPFATQDLVVPKQRKGGTERVEHRPPRL